MRTFVVEFQDNVFSGARQKFNIMALYYRDIAPQHVLVKGANERIKRWQRITNKSHKLFIAELIMVSLRPLAM